MNILVTGGAGYIGSHFILELLKDPSVKIVVVDNFSQGKNNIINDDRVIYEEVDLLDKEKLQKVFDKNTFDAVVHFAALASVPDSVARPLYYYRNNIIGGLNLLEAMELAGVKNIIFSSSAATYGNPVTEMINEDHPKIPINPYGYTKLVFENILKDFNKAYALKSVSFRYFCAAGSDPTLKVGENHIPETHVIPCLVNTLLGKRQEFFIFGNDYPTADGTAIRDYIHVIDLASAHVLALDYLLKSKTNICDAYNLGINRGYSVLELIGVAEKISGKKLNYSIQGRRPGDPVSLVADATKARKELGWSPRFGIDEIFKSAYEYLKKL